MAIDTEVLDVLLRLSGVRTFQTQMAEARGSVAEMGATARGTSGSMAAMGSRSEKAAAIAKKAWLGTAAGLAIAAGESYKLSVDFDKQMTLVQTQAGASASEMGTLKKAVLDMSHTLPQGPLELVKGLYHMESVFHNTKAAIDGTREAAKGAAVGNSNLEATTTALAAATRAMYTDTLPNAHQLNHIMGILNATVGAGNMRMDELAQALGTAVVPAGKNAGLTLQDIGGALATLTDEGQRADNAATHLRMAFTLMGASSKIARKNLASIGINATELGAKLHGPNGLVEALTTVKEHLEAKFPTFGTQLSNVTNPHDALELAKRFNVISRAFGGARSSATIMLLLNNLDMLQNKVTDVYIHSNKTAEDFARTQQTSAYKLHTAWSSLQSDMIQFGDRIRGPVTVALVALVAVLDQLIKHMDVIGPAIIALGAAWLLYKAAVIGATVATSAWEMVMTIGTIIALVGEITSLADAFALVSLAIEATPVGWIITAIAAVILVIALLVTHWKQVKNAIADAWDYVNKHWVFFAVVLGPVLGGLIVFIHYWKQIKGVAGDVFDFLTSAADKLSNKFGGVFKGIANIVIDAFNMIIKVINFAIDAYNSIPGILRPTGKIGHIGNIGRIGDNPAPTPKDLSMKSIGKNLRIPNTLGELPAPNSAKSLRKPRAHTPDPTALPLPNDPSNLLNSHFHFYIDGKELTGVTVKRTQDKRARR